MLRTLISGAMKVRLVLWAIELVLPDRSDLKERSRSALLGIMAAVAGGVLAALTAATMVAYAAYMLVASGTLTVPEVILACLATLLAGAIGLVVYGRYCLERASAGLGSSLSSPAGLPENPIHALVDGFISGLVAGERNHPPQDPEAEAKILRMRKRA